MAQGGFVVDTNVLVAADRRSNAGPECELATARFLRTLSDGGQVVIDDGFRILREYLNNRTPAGMAPGLGAQFLAWLLANQATGQCVRVPLTELAEDEFAEFPSSDPDLVGFDRNDRKFAAVARVANATVANATDSDWEDSCEALERNGILVLQLCS